MVLSVVGSVVLAPLAEANRSFQDKHIIFLVPCGKEQAVNCDDVNRSVKLEPKTSSHDSRTKNCQMQARQGAVKAGCPVLRGSAGAVLN